jgi:DNA-binding CsgD family transcriptional regulator
MIGGEHRAERRGHAIKAGIREGHLLRVALHPFDVQAGLVCAPASERKKLWRHVEADHLGTEPRGGDRDIAAAAGPNVEQPKARHRTKSIKHDSPDGADQPRAAIPVTRRPCRSRLAAKAVRAVHAANTTIRPSVSGGVELLDRGEETGVVSRLMANAISGTGGVVMLEGPAGIGKTALVRVANELAADQRLKILRATGSELESGFPFGVARQLLERAFEALAPPERARVLAGSARLADQVLGADPRLSTEATERHAAVHALFRLTTNLIGDQPTLITIDDAHWADLTSLEFVHYLARRIADAPIALLIAARPPAAVAGADPLRALLSVDDVQVLRPAPLSTPAVAELTRRALGAEPAPEFVASCSDATGGNAFLVTELLRTLAREGTLPSSSAATKIDTLAPDAVSDRITGWLAALPDPGPAVVGSLSVLGEAGLPMLAEHAGVPVSVARDVCDRLAQASLLADGDQLGFAHPLLARSVAGMLSATERSDGHLRAARLLRESGSPLDACAVHLLVVRPAADEWVVSILADAAAAANARGAPAEAIGYLKRALAEPAPSSLRPRLMVELGSAQLRTREIDAAQSTLRGGLELAPPPEIRDAMAIALSQACFLAGDTDAAFDVLEHQRGLEEDQQRVRVLDANAISLGLLDPHRCDLMRARLHAYRRLAHSGGLSEPTLNALAGAELILAGEPGDDGVALIRRAFENGLTAFGEHTFAYGWAVCALDAHDLSGEAIDHLDRALAQARPRADAAITGYLLNYRTHLGLRLGRLAEAEADGRGACELMAQREDTASFPFALLDVLVERGMAEEAWDLFCRQDSTGSQQRSAMMELVGARVAIAVGRAEEALAGLISAGAQLDGMAFRHPQFAPWRAVAAPLADQLGRRDLALRLSGELSLLAERTGAPTALAQALRVSGKLHGDAAALSRSVQAAGRTGDLLEYACSLTELGSVQAQHGQREQARETLRSALAAAHESGALALADRARAELIAAGGRPRRAALRGVEALTPTELQVARLAADGLSNRDIADGLFVSLKTVEQHLARSYAKLEISGRAEIAAALQAPTPVAAPPAILGA